MLNTLPPDVDLDKLRAALIKRIRLPEWCDCYFWAGRCTPNERGRFCVDGHEWMVARLVWLLARGSVPERILQTCQHPNCVRLEHLTPGTHRDCMLGGSASKRYVARLHPEKWARKENNAHHLRPWLSQGERNGNAKLKVEDVRQIRALVRGGASPRAVARQFKITQSNVSQIVRLKLWKHVPAV